MHDKIQVIMDLMKELQGEMEPSASDLDERLGRKKPGLEVTKIEGDLPMHEAEEIELGDDDDGDLADDMELAMAEDESPEDKLKNRIMKLKG